MQCRANPLTREKLPMNYRDCITTRHPERTVYAPKSTRLVLTIWLHEVIEQVWRDEVFPNDWGSGILLQSMRTIVRIRRFQSAHHSRTGPTNPDSELGVDQIFTLRRTLEFRHGYQQPTAVCFIEIAAAFDCVYRESLCRIMELGGAGQNHCLD
ncbi:unnamed protein product [Schistocephalus solidus]|uniref:Reverse transcriptase domain-containing protein n=1 Tax=Schistocephalus solidus TaxID=70667 RepID=A0A183SHE1_SCHSO|nr:unnamed protein product [Schistocephalus solidus]